MDIWITKGLKGNSGAEKIRKEVFEQEQGFHNEFDEIDEIAYHVVFYEDGIPVATGRTFPKGKGNDIWLIGRIAVRKPYRGLGLGRRVMQEIETKLRSIGAKQAELSAQVQARGFYESLGYQAVGEEYLDQHCPHIAMKKVL